MLFSLAFLAAFLVVRVKRGACPAALILKTLASLGFVGGGLYGSYIAGLNLANLFIVLGLVFAMLGDIVLDLKVMHPEYNKTYLNSGIAVFSLSSIVYVVATILLNNGLEYFWALLGGSALISAIVAVIILLLEKPLKLDFSGYRVQVCIYSCVVTLAAVLSLSISFFIHGVFVFSIGALLILLSDLILSTTYFGSPKHANTLVIANHILYYLGELMIMAYIFFALL